MGRPRLEIDRRRTAHLRVRLTAAELATIEAQAAQHGVAFPDFVRERVLTGRVVVKQGRELAADHWQELRRIGVNLNQIAHRMNAGLFRTSDALEVKERAAQIVSMLVAGEIDEPGR